MRKNLFFLILLLAGGCLAPEALDEKFFVVDRTAYQQSSGILEIDGSYQRRSWGISEIRGRVAGETVELYGKVEFWGGEKTIAHQIKVPDKVNEVKIGDRSIWRRNPEKTEKTPPVERDTAVIQPAEEVKTAKVVKHLKCGGDEIGRLNVAFADYFSVFWGEPVISGDPAGRVAEIVKYDGSANIDIEKLNTFADLEVLEIKGGSGSRQIDLAGLTLLKLKKLVLENIEVTGLDRAQIPALEEFYLSDLRYVPVGKVALPPDLPELHTAGIQSFAGNFDFASLKGKPLKRLWINGDCTDFGFLKNMPLEELKLTGFRGFSGKLDVLHTLPLKKLRLTPVRMNDWSFLAGLKLQLLDIKCSADSNFSPELLKDMPLEVLRLTTSYRDYGDRWLVCRKMPLREFVLRGGFVPEKFLLSSRVERLGLFHCYWHIADPLVLLRQMSDLKHLAMWRIFRVNDGKRGTAMDKHLKWRKLGGRKKIESLCLSVPDMGFIRFFPGLKRLAIRGDVKKVFPEAILQRREFEILRLPGGMEKNGKFQVKYPHCTDIPVSQW